jgi:hypothetical protein
VLAIVAVAIIIGGVSCSSSSSSNSVIACDCEDIVRVSSSIIGCRNSLMKYYYSSRE